MRHMAALLVLVPLIAGAQGIIPIEMRGQTLVYLKDGTIDACGVRVMFVDIAPNEPTAAIYDLSFNLYKSGMAAVKGGSSNIARDDVLKGRLDGARRRVALSKWYVKADGSPATTPLKEPHQSKDDGFALYIAAAEPVAAALVAVAREESLLVGATRMNAQGERIFAGAIRLDPSENEQLRKCLKEITS